MTNDEVALLQRVLDGDPAARDEMIAESDPAVRPALAAMRPQELRRAVELSLKAHRVNRTPEEAAASLRVVVDRLEKRGDAHLLQHAEVMLELLEQQAPTSMAPAFRVIHGGATDGR